LHLTTAGNLSTVAPVEKLVQKCLGYYVMDAETPFLGDFVSKALELAKMQELLLGSKLTPTMLALVPWFARYSREVNFPNAREAWMVDYCVNALDGMDLRHFVRFCSEAKSLDDLMNYDIDYDPTVAFGNAVTQIGEELYASDKVWPGEFTPEPFDDDRDKQQWFISIMCPLLLDEEFYVSLESLSWRQEEGYFFDGLTVSARLAIFGSTRGDLTRCSRWGFHCRMDGEEYKYSTPHAYNPNLNDAADAIGDFEFVELTHSLGRLGRFTDSYLDALEYAEIRFRKYRTSPIDDREFATHEAWFWLYVVQLGCIGAGKRTLAKTLEHNRRVCEAVESKLIDYFTMQLKLSREAECKTLRSVQLEMVETPCLPDSKQDSVAAVVDAMRDIKLEDVPKPLVPTPTGFVNRAPKKVANAGQAKPAKARVRAPRKRQAKPKTKPDGTVKMTSVKSKQQPTTAADNAA